MHPKVTATAPLGSLIGGLLLGIIALPACGQEDAVRSATLPLAESQREAATVLQRDGDAWIVAREGEGDFICLADDPSDERFHVVCYHHSLEPYMTRGRELQAQGIAGRESIAKRWEEIDAGQISMPDHPAALYSLTGTADWSGDLESLSPLSVLYVAYATAEQLGVPAEPRPGRPWLMFPGKPTAHIMITP